jgi:membrane protein implicated in regulation of membrane protease activity
MKKKGWSSQVALKYALFQLPGLFLFFLILILVQRWTDLPLRSIWGLLILWVIKDVVLFFFVWRAYQRVANPLIGMKGVAEEQLAPSGYVRVRGELWKVEVIDSNLQIDKGEAVKVRRICGLTLFVEPYNDETNNAF